MLSTLGWIYFITAAMKMVLSFRGIAKFDRRVLPGYLSSKLINRNAIADPSLISRHQVDTSLQMSSLYGNMGSAELTKVAYPS